MGGESQVLLVSRRAALACVLGTLALAACGRGEEDGQGEQGQDRVDARACDAFFLWAGVSAPAWLARARTVYLLAGEVRRDGGFVPLRAVPRVRGPELWLTVRVERIDWPESVYRAVRRQLERWEAAGVRLAGLQIDFDAATRGLAGYARFLAGLRARLPRRWRLSATGLLDWAPGGDAQALAALAGVIDEIVLQTYQGRRTIPGYERYLDALRRLDMPYRIAVVEDGAWRAPDWLAADPDFRGCVVFLLSR